MKKLSLVLFLASSFSWAQMNYVALVKDADGVPVSNSNVDVRISIVDYADESSVYYSESHNTSTTADGIVTLIIGEGTSISGDFQAIDWSKKLAIIDAYDLDESGYTLGGKELIRKVPVAYYALNAGGIDSTATISATAVNVKNQSGTVSNLLDVIQKLQAEIKSLSESYTYLSNLISSDNSNPNTSATNKIYFENGTCKCPDANPGDSVTISGTVYTVVNDESISNEISAGNINLCTTLVTNMGGLFRNNTSFNSDIGFWDTSNVTIMNEIFDGATSFNQDIGNWDISSVTNMRYMFNSASAFNQEIGSWDVSSVINMEFLFREAISFNSDIGDWNTGNVENFNQMFYEADSFNQDIGAWDVSSVSSMENLFRGADEFNQDISSWDVSSVTNMNYMLNGAVNFNQDLSGWCVTNISSEPSGFSTNSALTNENKPVWGSCPSEEVAKIYFENGTCKCPDGTLGASVTIEGTEYTVVDDSTIADAIEAGNINLCTTLVTTMEGLFDGNATFNEDISFWDTSNVTNMRNMFKNAEIFDQDISIWDVSSVTNMSHMFNGAAAFNQDLNTWETGSVTNLSAMFWDATNFNGEINAWDTSNVTDMSSMFSCLNNEDCQFNQSLNDWDTSSVVDMTDMFIDAVNFNGNISDWDTSSVTSMRRMFTGVTSFNQNIGNWDTSSVVNMYAMFWSANAFNQYIGGWDTSSATDMEGMFRYATVFNQDISNWCVSNITSEPPNFGENSALTEEHKPDWGSCPNPNVESGTISPVTQTICPGNIPQTIFGTDEPGMTNPSYQWEISTDNVTFTPIVGASSKNYTPVSPVTEATLFRRVATSATEATRISSSAAVFITPVPQTILSAGSSSTFAPINESVCMGDSLMFIAWSTASSSFEFRINGSVVYRVNANGAGTATFDPATDMQNGYTLINGDSVDVIGYNKPLTASNTIDSSACSSFSEVVAVSVVQRPVVTVGTADGTNEIHEGGDPVIDATYIEDATYEWMADQTYFKTTNTHTTTMPWELISLSGKATVTIEVIVNTLSGCTVNESFTLNIVDNNSSVACEFEDVTPNLNAGILDFECSGNAWKPENEFTTDSYQDAGSQGNWSRFGDISLANVDNPYKTEENSSNGVLQITEQGNTLSWAGFRFNLDEKVNFPDGNEALSIKVYSKAPDQNVLIRLQDKDGNNGSTGDRNAITTKTGAWEELIFNFSSDASGLFDQLVVIMDFGKTNQTETTYWIDDIQFATPKPVEIPNEPTTAAPDPSIDESKVLSLYSDSYASVENVDFNPNWGQSTIYSEVSIDGNNTIKYENLNYQGTALENPIDLSGYDKLHVDYWTPNATVINLYLISPGPKETFVSLPVQQKEQWQTVEFSLDEFSEIVDLSDVFQLKVEGNGNVYFDNLFFSKGSDNQKPPHNPSFYYDATNTTFSTTSSFKDVISQDDSYQFSEVGGTSSSFPTYVSGKYYEFTPNDGGNNMRQDLSGSTSDDLNTLSSTSHTIFSVVNLGSLEEEDTFTNGDTTGGVLLMVYNNRVRGHVWGPSEVKLDHEDTSLQTGVWYIIGQRWDVDNGKIDVFLSTVNGLVDIDEGDTNIVNPPSIGPNLMGIDARGDSDGYGDFKFNQGVIYRTNLNDQEIQDVIDYLSAKVPSN